MVTLFIQILGFAYIVYCFVGTFISIWKDGKLIDEIEFYKRKNEDLEKELSEIKTERNIYRDLFDELYEQNKDIFLKDFWFEDDELVEVEDE